MCLDKSLFALYILAILAILAKHWMLSFDIKLEVIPYM